MIPEEIINEIRERSDIVELIGSVIDLKKSGSNFKALCPFHGEKTPSFMVSPEKQIYHCFGCGKGGNIFGFLMEYEGISFVEATKRLADRVGIDVVKYLGSSERRGKLDPFYHAMEFAGKYYKESLNERKTGRNAREYLEKRGIGKDMAELFGIGFAPPGWDGFYKASSKEGLSRDILLKLKLVLRSRGGSGYRDYFRNRIIYPISTVTDRLVGLAGRVLDGNEPKYLNTVESPIYSKGKILYGLNKARDHIRKTKTAILVEGYMDFLILWKAGFRNVAAVCGTSFTKEQSRLLARYAKRVYIINDGDRAGVRAAVRAADQLLAEGVRSKIVTLPEDEDPDSFVTRRGADALSELMESASDYFIYLSEVVGGGKETASRKSQVLKHLVGSISNVDDEIDREVYLQEVADIFSIPADTLRGQIETKGERRAERPARAPDGDRVRRNQKLLFRFGLENERYASTIVNNLLEDDIQGEDFRGYFLALKEAVEKGLDFTKAEFFGRFKEQGVSELATEIAFMDMPPGPVDDLLNDTLIWLKRLALRREMRMMKDRIEEIRSDPGKESSEEEIEIAEAYRKIAKELKKIGLQGGKNL